MNVKRDAKCEECVNADICKYKNGFIAGCNKARQLAVEMGVCCDINISCEHYRVDKK